MLDAFDKTVELIQVKAIVFRQFLSW